MFVTFSQILASEELDALRMLIRPPITQCLSIQTPSRMLQSWAQDPFKHLKIPLLGQRGPGAIPWKENLAMRNYEVTYIAHPDLDAEAFKQLNAQVQAWITDNSGKVEKVDVWGKRKLAYQINKQNEGQYVLLQTHMDPAFCIQLEHQFRLQESIMRFLVVAVDEEAEPA